jgi:hypothetical protein
VMGGIGIIGPRAWISPADFARSAEVRQATAEAG